jgi:hypothetical protein
VAGSLHLIAENKRKEATMKDQKMFDGGCLNCEFVTTDRNALQLHNCAANEVCEDCDNGTDMPCVACQYAEFANAYGMTQ